MKIGIIQSLVGAGGGNDMVLFSLIKAIQDKHQVTLYTTTKPLVDISKYKIKVKTLLPFRLKMFGLYQRVFDSKLAKKSIGNDLTIVLAGDMVIPATKTQKMIVYSQNNYEELRIPVKYTKFPWKLYGMPYFKMAIKARKKIKQYNIDYIVPSEYIGQQVKLLLGSDSTVINPPVNTKEFKVAEKTKQIMNVGRYSPEKGQEFLVEATSKTKHILTLFGSTSKATEYYYNKIAEKCNQLGYKCYVNEPRSIMIEELSKHKIFFAASAETFGIAVVEAMASGCIPIVPNNTANRETVPYPALRYAPNSPEDAAKKLNEAILGKHDHLLKLLYWKSKEFDESIFQEKFLKKIESYENQHNNSSL